MAVPFVEREVSVNENGCWIWQGAKSAGYGAFRRNGRMAYAHREAWLYSNFPQTIPEGWVVRHACDTPACVNPDHLLLGSYADNTHDMVERGRVAGWPELQRSKTDCPYGHEYTEANTYRTPQGRRQCRECDRQRSREYQRQRRARERRA